VYRLLQLWVVLPTEIVLFDYWVNRYAIVCGTSNEDATEQIIDCFPVSGTKYILKEGD
jgi:hypothetical protein